MSNEQGTSKLKYGLTFNEPFTFSESVQFEVSRPKHLNFIKMAFFTVMFQIV